MLIGSVVTTRRLSELGAIAGGLGGLIIFLGVGSNLLAERRSYEGATRSGHRRERLSLLAGSFLIGLGFLLLFIAARAK
jgi:hypothetical protein